MWKVLSFIWVYIIHGFMLNDRFEIDKQLILEYNQRQIAANIDLKKFPLKESITLLNQLPRDLLDHIGVVYLRIQDNKLYIQDNWQRVPGSCFLENLVEYLNEVLKQDQEQIQDCELIFILRDETHLNRLWEYAATKERNLLLQQKLVDHWTTVLLNAPIFKFSKDERRLNTGYALEQNNYILPDPFLTNRHRWEPVRNEVLEVQIPWTNRIDQVYWVGEMSGISFDFKGNGADLLTQAGLYAPRIKLVLMSLLYPQDINAKFIREVTRWGNTDRFDHLASLLRGTPHHVNGQHVAKKDHLKYKYLISIDGWTSAWERVPWILLSKSVLFLVETPKIQWFYHVLQPYVHYIPVKADLSDLITQIDWARNHDQEAERIALNAYSFASRYFTQTNMLEVGRVTLREYASLYNKNRHQEL